MKTYFISDTHFNHKNVIKYCDRPYKDVEEMNKDIIKKWNNTVAKDDVVWFLGDFSLNSTREFVKDLVPKLHGRKRMVMGNHDQYPVKFYLEAGFDVVYQHPVLLKNHFILSHAPLLHLMNTEKGFYYIFGHVHNRPEFIEYCNTHENTKCVCCELINYTPIEIPEFNSYVPEEELLF